MLLFTLETYSKFVAAKPSLKNLKIVDKQTTAESVFQVHSAASRTTREPWNTHRIIMCLEIFQIMLLVKKIFIDYTQ